MSMKLYDVIRKDQTNKGQVIEIATPEYAPELAEKMYGQSPRTVRRFSLKKIIIYGGSAVILTTIYIVGMKLVHAQIVVSNRHIPLSLNSLQLDIPNEKKVDPGRLSFQAIGVSDSDTLYVYGSDLQTSMTKASGNVVFINSSTRAVTIKNNTGITAANGKRYFTQAAVTVSAATTVKKVKTLGGSPSVPVIAADVGPAYNSGGTTFSVDGYSNKTLSGRSSGQLAGGGTGVENILTGQSKQDTILTLEARLTEKLKRETRALIPPGFITFPNLQFISIDQNSLILGGVGIKFGATMKGTLVTYFIQRDLLEQAIATSQIKDHLYPNVTIPEIGALNVTPLSSIPADPAQLDSLTVSISGPVTVITNTSPDIVQQDTLGISRRSFQQVITTIPEVDSAHYTLYPFWAPFFPSTKDRISVKVQ